MKPPIRKFVAGACALLTLIASFTPAWAGDPADDLKQIEYRYYFRGKYAEAVSALEVFLARADVTGAVAVRASEFLAASHVLSGRPRAGKDIFARLISADPAYAGPDPSTFKEDVIAVYGTARTEYAALAIRNSASADTVLANTEVPAASAARETSKPIYKKWWFYAGAAALAGVALAAAGGSDGGGSAAPSGTVVVGVTVR